jgi:hypothetical protein
MDENINDYMRMKFLCIRRFQGSKIPFSIMRILASSSSDLTLVPPQLSVVITNSTSPLDPAIKVDFYSDPSITISRILYCPSDATPFAFSIKNAIGMHSVNRCSFAPNATVSNEVYIPPRFINI